MISLFSIASRSPLVIGVCYFLKTINALFILGGSLTQLTKWLWLAYFVLYSLFVALISLLHCSSTLLPMYSKLPEIIGLRGEVDKDEDS